MSLCDVYIKVITFTAQDSLTEQHDKYSPHNRVRYRHKESTKFTEYSKQQHDESCNDNDPPAADLR